MALISSRWLAAYGFNAKKDLLAQLLALNQESRRENRERLARRRPRRAQKLSRREETGDERLHSTGAKLRWHLWRHITLSGTFIPCNAMCSLRRQDMFNYSDPASRFTQSAASAIPRMPRSSLSAQTHRWESLRVSAGLLQGWLIPRSQNAAKATLRAKRL